MRSTHSHVVPLLMADAVSAVQTLLQADNQGQVDGTVSSLQARCERLSAELEEAAVQVEVLNAKGQMYDDLQAKADRMVRHWPRTRRQLLVQSRNRSR